MLSSSTFSCFNNELGLVVLDQSKDMLRILDNLEAKIVEDWSFNVAQQIPDLLNMSLMLRKDRLLVENFDDSVYNNVDVIRKCI